MQIFLHYSACGIPIEGNESTMCAENARDIYSMDQGKEFCLQCYKALIIHIDQEPQAVEGKKKVAHTLCENHTIHISKPSELEQGCFLMQNPLSFFTSSAW